MPSLRRRHTEVLSTIIAYFSGRPGGRPLQEILKFFVGAIHESPVFTNGNRSFSGYSTLILYKNKKIEARMKKVEAQIKRFDISILQSKKRFGIINLQAENLHFLR